MEPFAAILLIVFGVPLSVVGLIALFSALILLLPGPIQQARINLEERPWRSIFLGLLNSTAAAIILGLLNTLMTNNWGLEPVFTSLMIFISMAVAIPTVIGLCATIVLVGTRLGEARKLFFTYLRGGGLLLLACLTPFVGWFIFTPLVLWASMGSVIGGLMRHKEPMPEVPEKS
ncbi:MAG: hypothetical protein JXB30_07505 [Anaerolineae bacterium]|nr:hypothetical protein [Anaerolineae bacterium]